MRAVFGLICFYSSLTRLHAVVVQPQVITNKLSKPQGLKFRPLTEEIWIVNGNTDDVTVVDMAQGTLEEKRDVYRYHFMDNPSSLAFSGDGKWFATCQESNNNYNVPSDSGNGFMGPTLWKTSEYADVNQDQSWNNPKQGSHYDMLHQAPWCMGIEWSNGNGYYIFDGSNPTNSLLLSDFNKDHGSGGHDHSDGNVKRMQVPLKRVPGKPGHMALDRDMNVLYIADTGNNRVVAVQPSTAKEVNNKLQSPEKLDYYGLWSVDWTPFVNVNQPTGLVLDDCLLFVGSYETGEITVVNTKTGQYVDSITTNLPGLSALEVGPDGMLWATTHAPSLVKFKNPFNSAACTAASSVPIEPYQPPTQPSNMQPPSQVYNGGYAGLGMSNQQATSGGYTPQQMPNTCMGKCGAPVQNYASCYCDQGCKKFGDCCGDYDDLCLAQQFNAAPSVSTSVSCVGNCYTNTQLLGANCFCDNSCVQMGDCCGGSGSYMAICGGR